MAQKKSSKKSTSRADREVSSVKKKSAAQKSAAAKKNNSKQAPAKEESVITHNGAVAFTCLALFILFTITAVKPEGVFLKVLASILSGVIGKAGFYLSIPVLFFLFFIHTFGHKKSVHMRSLCALAFLLCCGAIYHLLVFTQGHASGLALFKDLYESGTWGDSGGVVCGGLAMLSVWACGRIVSFIVFGVLAAIFLLGAMQITIPALISAIRNRPRDNEWEDEDEEDAEPYVEPAVAVVNHIANHQIEVRRQRRQKQKEEAAMYAAQQAAIPEPPQVLNGTPEKAKSMMDTIGQDINSPVVAPEERVFIPEPPKESKPARRKNIVPEEVIPTEMPALELDIEPPAFMTNHSEPPMEPVRAVPAKPVMVEKPEPRKETPQKEEPQLSAQEQVAAEIAQAPQQEHPAYCFPPIDLLRRPMRGSVDGTDEMRENSQRLNETLASFHIDAHIINVTRGPSVTRYEVELDKGVRLNKLTGCADDIALSLGASGVRIAAVPGKISIVGIEVPNRSVTMVSLREVIDSPEFSRAKGKSSFAVGKDISGSCIVGNIAKMPHLLIAGTTGSGKSVCMNSIILSLLYKAGPEDVKLIMVDPKMVELGIYNGIPHLLIPVVTDPKKAAGSLQWAVTEMMRRYKMMSDAGVRDLESYNSIMASEEDGQTLPQVVVIIDELADLMLVAAKEVEDSICRIAQMGRAAGMHLVIATQRPSADVITGLMKANIPSRIAFSVSSAMESRIILDTVGAEKLVGKGDMLFSPIGIGKPLRVQGCFVADSEVEAVASYVKDHYVASYDQEVLEEIERKAQQTGKKSSGGAADFAPNQEELDGDEMLPAAVDVILETGQASVSMLQRRLKLGYARAARIVDEMEEKGIVGPFQGSKPRTILITKQQWEAQKNGGQMDFEDLDDEGVPEELD